MTVMQKSAAFVLAATLVVPTMSYTSSAPVSAFEPLPWLERPQKIEPDPELLDPDLCLMDGCENHDIVICPARRRVKSLLAKDDCTRRPPTIQLLEKHQRQVTVDLDSRGSRLP